jgi:hypothetical protein
MRLIGIDFTSTPSSRKPITAAFARYSAGELTIEMIDAISSLEGFGALLRTPGQWVAGADFPFGQPIKYVANVGWPKSWREYVRHVAEMSRQQFIAEMRAYQRPREKGDIRHYRDVDRKAGSCSPMQLDFTPVARMFHAGAPILLESDCAVYPFVPMANDEKVIVEAYPALVARRCVGRESYKTDDKKKATSARRDVRERIVDALITGDHHPSPLRTDYGMSVRLRNNLASVMIDDSTGDTLDAVLCALQAAWAYSRRNTDFGMNWACDKFEGWIADPALLTETKAESWKSNLAGEDCFSR